MPAERKLGVLIVSDDPLIREEARYGFPEEVTVYFAVDSRDASRVLDDEELDVVVVDLQTGSAGGFNLVRGMRQHSRTAEIPALVLLERPQDSWLATQAGASASRVKPLDVSDLVTETLALTTAPTST